jgi:hypothetical protein
VILKGANAIGLPILELPLKPAIPIQKDTTGLGVNAILGILFQLSLEIDGLGKYGRQFLGEVINVIPVFMQLPPRRPRLVVILLEEVVPHLMDSVLQLPAQSQEDDIERHLYLKLVDPLLFLCRTHHLHLLVLHLHPFGNRIHRYFRRLRFVWILVGWGAFPGVQPAILF